MKRDLLAALARSMEPGRAEWGEVAVQALPAGGYRLCHVADRACDDAALPLCPTTAEARQLALLDAEGAYRPLRTAPNLRRGWRLFAPDLPALREALEAFYPAMLGLWADWQAGAVAPVPLRATLGRQSGMYAVTRRLSDEEAQSLIGCLCRSEDGCLKTILWPLSPGVPVQTLPPEKLSPEAVAPPKYPLLCHEACNLLVAKAREVVKGRGHGESAS